VEKVIAPGPRTHAAVMWAIIAASLLFLYVPLVPSVLLSFQDDAGKWTLASYGELLRTPVLIAALRTTAIVALLVAVLTPFLALIAAQSIRELGRPRLILLAMLLPLFIPAISMGLATGFLFRLLGVPPSLLTIVIIQVIWALPFATLIILTAMSTFDPVYLEAAYMSGAERWQAFRDIELPIIAPGVFGAASFSFIISINETVRTSVVQGRFNTIPTYIWSTYKQVGLSPVLHALMALVVLATIAGVMAYLAIAGRVSERELSG
jgi:ABC-type spermidine/putrescine transport system permease subunit II